MMGLFTGFKASQPTPFSPTVMRQGRAMRVIFFYPGEEGTYVENAEVKLYSNGMVSIRTAHEDTTVHIQNCEIQWSYQLSAEDGPSKFRLLKMKQEPPYSDSGPELQ